MTESVQALMARDVTGARGPLRYNVGQNVDRGLLLKQSAAFGMDELVEQFRLYREQPTFPMVRVPEWAVRVLRAIGMRIYRRHERDLMLEPFIQAGMLLDKRGRA